MHSRYRNGPANGSRPNALGMGGMAASPEGSMRGNRMYNSEYRNYNRGGHGRGDHSKKFQPPLPPPRETNIFMEAGRLAAEYLVARGVLPPNALLGKWQNDGLKNQVGNFLGFRPHEVDNMQNSANGRALVHSHSGDVALDVGPRRRYSDEYNLMGLKNSTRWRRRAVSEVNRTMGRSGSWIERSRVSPVVEADSEASAGHGDYQPVGEDINGVIQTPSSGEITQEGDGVAHLDSGLDKFDSVGDAGAKANSSCNKKYLPSDANEEPTKESVDAYKLNAEVDVVIEGMNHNNLEQKHDENKEITASVREDSLVSEENVDLLKHCKFANVPTKARSSLKTKGSKGNQDSMNENVKITERKLSKGFVIQEMDVPNDSSAGNGLESDVLNAPAVEKKLDVTSTTWPGQCSMSGSCPERSVYEDHKLDEGSTGFVSSNSTFMERGGKRALDDHSDCWEGNKKCREWVPPMNTQSDACLPPPSSMESQLTSQEPRSSQNARANLSPDQKSLSISLVAKGHAKSCELMEEEEEQFPVSFKTCDLNLIGTCDINENHDADPILIFPSIAETGKAVTPIDVDLSTSNNCNLPNKNGKPGVKERDIEVIDLENDSGPEDFHNHERRGDTVFTNLEGFPNHVHKANEIPDDQDGYGLMISEWFGNNSPNCSSVSTGLNSLHNDMGLPNGEGILGDDDSIYMSLEEIPISFVRAWVQPTHDYGKPF